MEKPLISVVIPAFNEESLLPRTLLSLERQDYQGDYEIIVVDNGSQDDTADVARRYGATVVSCPQRGVVHARQAGAAVARGTIIVQADADTVYPADWLRRIVEGFGQTKGTVAVAGEIAYDHPPFWVMAMQAPRKLLNWCYRKLRGRALMIRGAALAFQRDAFLACGGYNTALPNVGDEMDLYSRLRKVGRVAYLPEMVAVTSSRRHASRFWQFLVVDILFHTLFLQAFFAVFHRGISVLRPVPHVRDRRSYAGLGWAMAFGPLPAVVVFGVVAILTAFLVYGYFTPSAQAFGKTYARGKPPTNVPNTTSLVGEKKVALTFDDGPNEPYTSEVLDILRAYDVKVTFFVLGKNVEYYPQTAQRIVQEGHVIANHTYSHKAVTEIVEWPYVELNKTQETVYATVGVKPALFRPPFGHKTPWQLAYVHRRGMTTVTWSVSANDPHATSSQVIAQRIVEKTRPWSIILLHDGNEMHHGADRSATVNALPLIIQQLQAQGYTFVTVPELLSVRAYLPATP